MASLGFQPRAPPCRVGSVEKKAVAFTNQRLEKAGQTCQNRSNPSKYGQGGNGSRGQDPGRHDGVVVDLDLAALSPTNHPEIFSTFTFAHFFSEIPEKEKEEESNQRTTFKTITKLEMANCL